MQLLHRRRLRPLRRASYLLAEMLNALRVAFRCAKLLVMIIRGSRFSSVVLRSSSCSINPRPDEATATLRSFRAKVEPMFNFRGRVVAASGRRVAGVQLLRRARVLAVAASKSVAGLLSACSSLLSAKVAAVSQSSLRSSRSAGAGRLLSKVVTVSESVGRLRGRLGAPSGALRGRALVVSDASCVESSWGEDFDYFGRAAAREDRPSGGGGGG